MRDDKFSHCTRCGSRLNNHPDRLCASCTHGDHHDDPQEDES